MSLLLHGDCLEHLHSVDDNSIDLIFCDLPYGQTSCKWDDKIDLTKLWEHFMRIKKANTPLFFTTTTKFGVELIQSAPKKCFFRYDLVWVKSAPAGFLCAKKMPMRKHEMIYVFYEKLPFYDLSSHKHKFIKDGTKSKEDNCYGVQKLEEKGKYEPPLPVSVIKKVERESAYGDIKTHDLVIGENTGQSRYDPPLPTTMLEIKSTRGKHSTEKPVELMSWILKYYSKEGDVVLDPTMGSGSTGVACKNMNRNFIGIEMDDEIYEIACNRIYN
jgi:site-specific DNA-methyltransferase (adenine-specific)